MNNQVGERKEGVVELAKTRCNQRIYTWNNQDTNNVLGIYSTGTHQEPSNRVTTFLSKEYVLLINYQHCTCSHAQTLLRGHNYSVRLLQVIIWDFSSSILRPSHLGLGFCLYH